MKIKTKLNLLHLKYVVIITVLISVPACITLTLILLTLLGQINFAWILAALGFLGLTYHNLKYLKTYKRVFELDVRYSQHKIFMEIRRIADGRN